MMRYTELHADTGYGSIYTSIVFHRDGIKHANEYSQSSLMSAKGHIERDQMVLGQAGRQTDKQAPGTRHQAGRHHKGRHQAGKSVKFQPLN